MALPLKIFSFHFRLIDTGKYEIVVPGNVSAEREVPDHIKKPDYYFTYIPPDRPAVSKPEIKLNNQIIALRESCEIAATILEKCSKILEVCSCWLFFEQFFLYRRDFYFQPGVTTDQIDEFVHNEAIQANAYPSPLRYADFPKSVIEMKFINYENHMTKLPFRFVPL